MTFRLTTLSTQNNDGVQYQTGDLSLYPLMLDDANSLYTVTNNAETELKQSISYNASYVIVNDASAFPPYGVLRIGNKIQNGAFELIYYNSRNNTTFMNLIRGFAGSTQNVWQSSNTYVGNAVEAESHNAIKDAIIKMQTNLGLIEEPDPNSLNGILTALENKFLAPNPLFHAYPLIGPPGVQVRFQNFSNSEAIRFLWDFGDGTQSSEQSPIHTYLAEGIYSVQLNMIMSTGAQGIKIKSNYITVSSDELSPFFYATQISDTNSVPATFEFVDQTDGDILNRYWVFDDGTSEQVVNPNIHTIQHTYQTAGSYIPSLLIVFTDQSLQRVFLQEGIQVT